MVCKLQLEVKISFTARTDRNMSLYYSGRGLTPYLHSRNYETSSTDNDGASKIFASSSYSTMSDKETDASPLLSLPRTFSYMSTSSSFTWSDTASISTTRNMFQYSTSSTERSIDDETLILRSETRLMANQGGESETPGFQRTRFTPKQYRRFACKLFRGFNASGSQCFGTVIRT